MLSLADVINPRVRWDVTSLLGSNYQQSGTRQPRETSNIQFNARQETAGISAECY